MKTTEIGNTSLKISQMTLGCWCFGGDSNSYWGAQSQEECNALVRTAIERGINCFDTAFMYNDGAAERSLGKAIQGGLREKMIICNKIPFQPREALPTYEKLVRNSLERLGTDYVDMLLIHWPSNDKDLLRANLEHLQKMKELGMARHIGVSNFGVGQMEIVREMGIEICINEIAYNMMHRGAEMAVFPYARKHNIGIMAYMPLMQGILTGKYASLEEIPIARRRTLHFDSSTNDQIRHGGKGMEKEFKQFLTDLHALSEQSGLSCSVLSIAWMLTHQEVSTVLGGCRNLKQLEENITAFEAQLQDDLVNRLDEISQPIAAQCGANCDLWQWNSRIW